MPKPKKNMGTVADLIKAAPVDAVISDGTQTYRRDQALNDANLKASILDAPVHSVKDGAVYIEVRPTFIPKAITVVAVRIEKKKEIASHER